jgi:hypothetical protein
MSKKCKICGFDDGHNFKCPNKTPPKPELKYYPDRFVIDGTTKSDGKRYFAYTIESVDALIEWHDKERSARDIEIEWLKTQLKEMRK